MTQRIVDVTLENLFSAPAEVLEAVFWELGDDDPPADPRFQKEEWFSSTLLEWGPCGKLLEEDARVVGFAEYAPPSLFPRLARFRCGKRASKDAAYLSYCYLVGERRGRDLGTELVRAVARDLAERGVQAVEAIGDRESAEGWVLPAGFLAANGFVVVRPDLRFPLMRLDLTGSDTEVREEAEEAALPLTRRV